MKVKHAEYTIEPRDVEMVYRGILTYIDALNNYQTWASNEELPRKDIALENIREEIQEYTKLSADIYNKCFNAFLGPATEREPR